MLIFYEKQKGEVLNRKGKAKNITLKMSHFYFRVVAFGLKVCRQKCRLMKIT